jgi:hypothetical protein
MGLVQAKPDETEEGRDVDLGELRIIWDANVERMSENYGKLFIDHVKSMFGPRFVVGFDGVSC